MILGTATQFINVNEGSNWEVKVPRLGPLSGINLYKRSDTTCEICDIVQGWCQGRPSRFGTDNSDGKANKTYSHSEADNRDGFRDIKPEG